MSQIPLFEKGFIMTERQSQDTEKSQEELNPEINVNSDNQSAQLKSEGSFPWLRNYPQNVDWYASFETKPLFEILDETKAVDESQA